MKIRSFFYVEGMIIEELVRKVSEKISEAVSIILSGSRERRSPEIGDV
ncbi:MAG: hypothetical protein ACK4TF_08975 [Thermodesulfovibrionales bacterium]